MAFGSGEKFSPVPQKNKNPGKKKPAHAWLLLQETGAAWTQLMETDQSQEATHAHAREEELTAAARSLVAIHQPATSSEAGYEANTSATTAPVQEEVVYEPSATDDTAPAQFTVTVSQ